MDATITQIIAAILLVAVIIAIFIWIQRSEAAGSARRTMAMIKRIGLAPRLAKLGGARTNAIMKETRRRCRRCPREDLCERWLAGEVEGSNAFCPNAPVYRGLMDPGKVAA